ncbi:MAG TPA: hypothetical protein VKT52_10425 [Ktedonobacterales bacterium]|nr:hypothetical protein [Ktedonobacterales bacterium]
MMLASCCGPFDDASPDLLKTWAIAALVCGVLLLLDAAVLAWIRRREGECVWRQRAVQVALAMAIATFVLAQRTWNAYLTVPSMPETGGSLQTATFPIDDALGWIAPLGGIAILVTLLLLMLGLVELAIHFSEG